MESRYGRDRSLTVSELLARIERSLLTSPSPLLVAIDGPSGAGKSTLAEMTAAPVGAAVVHGDDFYAGGSPEEWDARTPKENSERCVDWRRLRAEALEPLLAGRQASWHAFDWHAGHGLSERLTVCSPAPVIILEGVYAAQPALDDLLALSVLVDPPAEIRRRHLLDREGDKAFDDWYRRWDEAETYYFREVRPPSSFDVIIRSMPTGHSHGRAYPDQHESE